MIQITAVEKWDLQQKRKDKKSRKYVDLGMNKVSNYLSIQPASQLSSVAVLRHWTLNLMHLLLISVNILQYSLNRSGWIQRKIQFNPSLYCHCTKYTLSAELHVKQDKNSLSQLKNKSKKITNKKLKNNYNKLEILLLDTYFLCLPPVEI